jgi:hypothetical protein
MSHAKTESTEGEDKLTVMMADTGFQSLFCDKPLFTFWMGAKRKYKNISNKALH